MGEGDRFSGGGGVVKENTVLLSYATPPVSEADSPLSEGVKKSKQKHQLPTSMSLRARQGVAIRSLPGPCRGRSVLRTEGMRIATGLRPRNDSGGGKLVLLFNIAASKS